MKKIILSLLFLFITFFSFAQATNEKPVIVITPVDLYDIDQKSGDLLFRRIQSEFVNTYKFSVVDRGALSKILAEKEFQDNSEWSSPEKIARLKEAFNAQYIVTSVIESFEGIVSVTINIIDVNTTQIIASENSNVNSVMELINGKIKTIVIRVSSKIQTDSSQTTYIIGGLGAGGGIVFYYSKVGFNVYNADGTSSVCHYLECSQEALGEISWCSKRSGESCCSPETKTELGYGKYNCAKILSAKHSGGNLTITNCAALVCTKYSTLNTSAGDWWLPSKDELNLLYENLKKEGFIEDSGWLWSSSSSGSNDAWVQRFSDGSQGYGYKNDTYSVRAIRAF